MTCNLNALKLADELAEIARTTTDAITGDKLMRLVDWLLTHSGLPDDAAAAAAHPAAGSRSPFADPGDPGQHDATVLGCYSLGYL